MDRKVSDHAYHRSRVDAHIGGSVVFIFFMLALAFLVGDKFQPFHQGADMWSSTLLVWRADSNAWIPAYPSLRRELSEQWTPFPQTSEPHDPGPWPTRPSATGEAVMEPIVDPVEHEPAETTESVPTPEDEEQPADTGVAESAETKVGELEEVEAAAPTEDTPSRPAECPTPMAFQPAPVITKEIYAGSYSVVVVLAALGAAYFLYGCARRQAYLMLSVYGEDDKDRPYDRPWEEVRVTFWALFCVLVGVLFLFVM